MNELIADLIAAGTPAELVARVAMELGRAQGEVDALARRRASDAERQQAYRISKREACHVTSRDVTNVTNERDTAPLFLPPNEKISNPPTHTPEQTPRARKGSDFVCPDGVDPGVWQDFMTNRKRKGLASTGTAYAGLLAALAKVSAETGEPPGEVARICTEKGWGSFNDWTDGRVRNNGNVSRAPASRDPRNGFARALDEIIDSGGNCGVAREVERPPDGYGLVGGQLALTSHPADQPR